MKAMETCQWCSEELGDERRCQSCGRVQYRYALDEGTNEAEARTQAADAEQDRIDDLYGREEVLQEIVDVLGGTVPPTTPSSPPPLRRQQPPPSQPVSRVPERSEPVATGGPTPNPGQTRTIAGCLTSTVILGIGLVLFLTITQAEGDGRSIDLNRVFSIVTALVLVLLFRRRLRNRKR